MGNDFRLRDQPQDRGKGHMSPAGWQSVQDDLELSRRGAQTEGADSNDAKITARADLITVVNPEHLIGLEEYITEALVSSGGKKRYFKRHQNSDGIGGFVESTATVDPTATVSIDSIVIGKAQVLQNSSVTKGSVISGNAVLRDLCQVINSKIDGKALISGNAQLEESEAAGSSKVCQNAKMYRSRIWGSAMISGNATANATTICGNALVIGDVNVHEAIISGDSTVVKGKGSFNRDTDRSVTIQ